MRRLLDIFSRWCAEPFAVSPVFRFFLAGFFVVLLTACGSENRGAVREETVVFGTRAEITIVGVPRSQAREVVALVFDRFRRLDDRFYAWRPDSETSRINRRIANQSLPVTVSGEMAGLLVRARDYAVDSEGLFNPALGRLVDLWGFYDEPPPSRPPSPQEIGLWLRTAPSMADFRLAGDRLVAAPASAQLDFGAVIKGVALDQARDLLRQHGVRHALVNLGGNLIALGNNGGEPWRVALQQGVSPPPVITLHDGQAVATSGDRERFFVHEGIRYHHILDPRTGYPATAKRTATVISDDPVAAGAISDVVATALVIGDDEETRRILNRFAVLFFRRNDGSEWIRPDAQDE